MRNMGDSNMAIAIQWADELGPAPSLPLSLQKVTQRAKLVNKINTSHTANLAISLNNDNEKKLSNEKKAKCQSAIAILSREYISDVNDDKILINISLRLWSGCLSGVKIIALGTEDGLNTPETRLSQSRQIEHQIQTDLIYRAGVEAAPFFKKLLGEPICFEGVPKNSPLWSYILTEEMN